MKRSVTLTAKHAIADSNVHTSLRPSVGDPADFVILQDVQAMVDAVLDASSCYQRTTIHAGRVVACRTVRSWNAGFVDKSRIWRQLATAMVQISLVPFKLALQLSGLDLLLLHLVS